jgi:hypothetical protein
VVVALAACGEAVPTTEPTIPTRPPVPGGWQVVSTDAGDVIMAVAGDVIVANTSGSIGGFRRPAPGVDELIVAVTGPSGVEQREPGELLDDSITRGNWLTGGRGEPLTITRHEVLLPAGPALEVIAAYRFQDKDRWTMLHVIDTGRGYALLQFDGGGPAPETAPDEIQLMRALVEFAP